MIKRSVFQHFYHGYDNKTFVQIGANDAWYGDFLSYWVKKYHWKGILVEPIKTAMEKCKKYYEGHHDRLIFDDSVISDKNGTITFLRIPDEITKEDGKSCNVSSGVMPVWGGLIKLKDKIIREKRKCITFNRLLEKHNFPMPEIVVTDTNGFDGHIIRSIDFSKGKPQIIVFEHKGKKTKIPDYEECIDFLKANGYKNFYRFKNNIAAHRVSWKK